MSEPTRSVSRPLDGVKVVEVGVWLAGPGAGAIMSDLGAEVIKIETLSGDPLRTQGNFGPLAKSFTGKADWSIIYEMANRGKKSVCVDLNTPDGYDVLLALVKDADIFMTNLRPRTKAKIKIDYESLAKVNAQLIHLNVSGFGQHGKFADVGAFDPMGQAMTGMMFLAGLPEPTLLQMVILDQLTAITASHAAVTALYRRSVDGRGQDVHVSLYGSAVWLMHGNLLVSSILQQPMSTTWNRTTNSPLRTTFQCGDGRWIIGTHHPEEKHWPNFCRTIGRADLLTDPRFDTKEKRSSANAELVAIVSQVFLTKSRLEWLDILVENGLFFAPIQTLSEVLVDSQAHDNNYLTEMEIPEIGCVTVPGYPIEFGLDTAGPTNAAPALGEHTSEVLLSLGYSAEQIASLEGKAVVR